MCLNVARNSICPKDQLHATGYNPSKIACKRVRQSKCYIPFLKDTFSYQILANKALP